MGTMSQSHRAIKGSDSAFDSVKRANCVLPRPMSGNIMAGFRLTFMLCRGQCDPREIYLLSLPKSQAKRGEL